MASGLSQDRQNQPLTLEVRAGRLRCRVHKKNGQHGQIRNRNIAFQSREYRLVEFSWEESDLSIYLTQGEASPLPGYGNGVDCVALVDQSLSESSLTTAIQELENCFSKEVDLNSSHTRPKTESMQEIVRISRRFRVSPSARFAIETAAIGLLCKFRKQKLSSLLAEFFLQEPKSSPERAFSSVISIGPDTALTQSERLQLALRSASKAQESGSSALKIKCGTDWSDEYLLLKTLRQQNSQLQLRADFNQGLGEMIKRELAQNAEAQTFSERVKEIQSQLLALSLQWVEDPGVLLSLVPTALDEPLVQGLPTTSELRQSGHAFVLIKPMVLGSIETIALLEERAQAAKMQVCVSHFFDGPQALKFYWALHDALPQAVSPAGLSNHPGLKAYA